MKKVILAVILLIATQFTNAQSTFDKLEDLDGVDVVVLTKDAFELMSKFKDVKVDDSEAMQVFKMIQDINEFKMFSSSKADIAQKMEDMTNTVIKNKSLTELMRVKEDNSRVKIYIKSTKNKDVVSEVLMFIKDIDSKTNGLSKAMILSLTGNIDINKLSDLADTITKDKKTKK